MSWSGGAANRQWNRAAGQAVIPRLPPETEHQLYLEMLDKVFWCDHCNGTHPLRDHKACRDS